MPHSDVPARWQHWADRCETTLRQALDARREVDARLVDAMAWAALAGGKRMRPLLVYATGTALGMEEAALDVPAVAAALTLPKAATKRTAYHG